MAGKDIALAVGEPKNSRPVIVDALQGGFPTNLLEAQRSKVDLFANEQNQ